MLPVYPGESERTVALRLGNKCLSLLRSARASSSEFFGFGHNPRRVTFGNGGKALRNASANIVR